jgi:hypothetical protein
MPADHPEEPEEERGAPTGALPSQPITTAGHGRLRWQQPPKPPSARSGANTSRRSA